MNVKVEVRSQESWRRVLAIEVSAEDATREYDRVARKFAQEVRLPGFRKGKVPSAVVRKTFKSDVDREFLEEIVPLAFGQALEETKLSPVSDPKFAEISYGEERPLSFVAEFESLPDLEIKGYTGLAIEKEVPEVPDSAVDEILDEFRKSKATPIEVDREAISGDVLVLDAQAVDGEGHPIPSRALRNYSVELGVGQVAESLEAALAKARAGDVRVADLGDPPQRYRIKVRVVQEKKFPSLDDALVAAHTDVKTVEELRAKVRADLESRADRMGTSRVEDLLLEKVVDGNPFEPPESVVEALLDDLAHRARHDAEGRGEDSEKMDLSALKDSHREGARRQARRIIVLDLLARQEKIQVEAEEIRERVDRLARLRGTSPRALVRDLGGDRFLRSLSREIRDKKVLAFLAGNAEITRKSVRLAPA